jgi:hypothetical protein
MSTLVVTRPGSVSASLRDAHHEVKHRRTPRRNAPCAQRNESAVTPGQYGGCMFWIGGPGNPATATDGADGPNLLPIPACNHRRPRRRRADLPGGANVVRLVRRFTLSPRGGAPRWVVDGGRDGRSGAGGVNASSTHRMSPHGVGGPFVLMASLTCADLTRVQLLIVIKPGSPLMHGSRFR